ncbi:MAG: site-specific integrase [Fusobacteriaceae bacterium]|nr:site-specific integrase [Fusobacteriaceae bacterium]
MKYKNDFLNSFKKELENKIENKNTRKNYFYEIKKAFKNQEFSNINDFDYKKLKEYVESIKGKRSASTLKCSLELFSEKYKDFEYTENKSFLKDQVKQKTSRRLTKWEDFNLSKTLRKINSLQDKKLKLAYRLMFASGGRVEEISHVRKEDIIFEDGHIKLFINKAKYGKQRTVKILDGEYKYLKEHLKNYINDFENGQEIFYSKDYLITKASEYDFMCHDLRRAYSQIISDNEELTEKEAIEETQKNLGHKEDTTTYKKYWNRKINFTGTKYDI